MADERAAVVLDDGRQVIGSEASVGHPARELVVPHAVVPAEKLAIGLRQVRDLVTAREGELAARGLGSVLYH